jgi:hypothetical protein
MNNIVRYISVFSLAAILLLSSCIHPEVIIDSPEKDSFLKMEVEGYYRGGVDFFTYNEYKHQRVSNISRNEFRIQTDSQSEYMNLVMESLPKSIGVNLLCEFTYHSDNDDIAVTMLFECSKLTEDMIWLWFAEEKIGVILKK